MRRRNVGSVAGAAGVAHALCQPVAGRLPAVDGSRLAASLGLAIGLAADSFGLRSMLLGLETLAVASVAGAWARREATCWRWCAPCQPLDGRLAGVAPDPPAGAAEPPQRDVGLWALTCCLAGPACCSGPLVLGPSVGRAGGGACLTRGHGAWLARIGVPPDGRRASPVAGAGPVLTFGPSAHVRWRARAPGWWRGVLWSTPAKWLAVIGFAVHLRAGGASAARPSAC